MGIGFVLNTNDDGAVCPPSAKSWEVPSNYWVEPINIF